MKLTRKPKLSPGAKAAIDGAVPSLVIGGGGLFLANRLDSGLRRIVDPESRPIVATVATMKNPPKLKPLYPGGIGSILYQAGDALDPFLIATKSAKGKLILKDPPLINEVTGKFLKFLGRRTPKGLMALGLAGVGASAALGARSRYKQYKQYKGGSK